jgi:hypothetical protein
MESIRRYISNGAFIHAAIELGYEGKAYVDSLNAIFKIKMKSAVFTILPVAFLPLIIVFSKQIKSIKEELEKR